MGAKSSRRVVALAVVGAALSGCNPVGAPDGELSGHRITVQLPPGWHGRIAERGRLLPGAAIVHIASFPLPPKDDDWATKARQALGTDGVLLVLSEGLRQNLPDEEPRIDPGSRLAAVDGRFLAERWFVASDRAFVLQVVFGSRRPTNTLIRKTNAVLANLSIARRDQPLQAAPDPAPAAAFATPRLFPTPRRVLNQCRLAQARSRFPILCPVRLPRPFLGWPNADPPMPAAQRLPAPGVAWRSRSDERYRNRTFSGVSIGYGAPWEPDSGPDWRLHLWRNRPCCFLHFEVFWRQEGPRHVPAGARSATIGGRRGLLKDATSYGLVAPNNDHLYWSNHTRFLWRENGVPYVATLHRFGKPEETRALLDRLIRELRPAAALD